MKYLFLGKWLCWKKVFVSFTFFIYLISIGINSFNYYDSMLIGKYILGRNLITFVINAPSYSGKLKVDACQV